MAQYPEHSGDDPWTLAPGAYLAPPEPVLNIKVIENVEPLDKQMGVFPKKTVPDALQAVLFGQPDPTPIEIEAAGGDPAAVSPMQTYALLDAARIDSLPELLEQSGLEHRCLFKGAAFDELKDVAPWIVRLEEGNAFTRRLFTRSEASWHLWDKEPGIYLRCRSDIEEIFRHFRRFLRFQDEDDRWFYYRFWDAQILATLSTRDRTMRYVLPLLSARCDITLLVPYGRSKINIISRAHEKTSRRPETVGLRYALVQAHTQNSYMLIKEEFSQSAGAEVNQVKVERYLYRLWNWAESCVRDVSAVEKIIKMLKPYIVSQAVIPQDIVDIISDSKIGHHAKVRLVRRWVET